MSLTNEKLLFDFLHYLRDALVLLGCKIEIANILDNPEEISSRDIENVRQLNCQLIDATKEKLVNIHKIKIVVGSE